MRKNSSEIYKSLGAILKNSGINYNLPMEYIFNQQIQRIKNGESYEDVIKSIPISSPTSIMLRGRIENWYKDNQNASEPYVVKQTQIDDKSTIPKAIPMKAPSITPQDKSARLDESLDAITDAYHELSTKKYSLFKSEAERIASTLFSDLKHIRIQHWTIEDAILGLLQALEEKYFSLKDNTDIKFYKELINLFIKQAEGQQQGLSNKQAAMDEFELNSPEEDSRYEADVAKGLIPDTKYKPSKQNPYYFSNLLSETSTNLSKIMDKYPNDDILYEALEAANEAIFQLVKREHELP